MENHKQMPWHSRATHEILESLDSSEEGLTDTEAEKRLKENGLNELRKKPNRTTLQMLWSQITDAMVLILIGAAILSLIFGEFTEAFVILIIVTVNAVIGIVQEKKAESSLEALKNMNSPTARVMRDGEENVIPASNLVVGDIVFLEDGAMVPADLRLIETSSLKIQEASLTGESVPSEKDADTILPKEYVLGDRSNMAYTSSIVTYGRGVGVVVATGMNTEVGNIAHLLDSQDDFDTPIKRKLNTVGKTLSVIGIIVCVVIFAIGAFYQRPLLPMFMIAISLAISIIPEGLPATATIVMALGVQRMSKRNALIRKLPAVETLGGATVICC
ncbi:HAD-IC family P-type ATPase, partial [Clostridioides difficile]|nr:HAD-IC family P-type ATPase [Clostridioides difficile]